MIASLFLSLSIAADPVGVRLPELAAPTPMPRPNSPVSVLKADHWYVIDASIECVVRAHPADAVTIEKKKGPRDISAKFADGNGTVQDRSYEGPFLYVVKAAKTARVSIDIIPLGFKSEAEIKNVTLDVNAGPRPPPDGDEKKEDAKPNKVEKLRVTLIRDAGDMSPELAQLTTDLPFWKSISDKGHIWRFYHKDDPDGRSYWADAGEKQAVLIYDNANPKTPLKVIPLPAKKDTIADAIKEYSK